MSTRRMGLLLLVMVLVSALAAGAWGPITHIRIAGEVAQEIPIGDMNAYLLGAVMPDMALATGSSYLDHNWLHSESFYNTLRSLAETPTTTDFVKGWLTHITSDKIEQAYSQQKIAQGAPWSADYAVDRLKGYTYSSGLRNDSQVADLLEDAWRVNGRPGSDWGPDLEDAIDGFNAYLYLLWQWVTPDYQQAQKWYGDYYGPYDLSVSSSVEALRNNGAPMPTPTPAPTPAPWNWSRRPTPTPRTPTPTATPVPAVTPTPRPTLVPSPTAPPPPRRYPWGWRKDDRRAKVSTRYS